MKSKLLGLLMLMCMGTQAQTYVPDYQKNLNIAYLIPADVPAEPNFQDRVSKVMLYAQQWYKDEMARNGYPNKTFGLVKDAALQQVRIDVVTTTLGKASLNSSSTVLQEVNNWYAKPENAGKKTSQHVLVLMPAFGYGTNNPPEGNQPLEGVQPFNGSGTNCIASDNIYVDMYYKDNKNPAGRDNFSKWVGGLMHEIGHAFRLPHNNEPAPISGNMRQAYYPADQVADYPADYRPSLMGIGNSTLELYPNNPTILTKSDSDILNACEIFNDNSDTYYADVTSGLSSIHAVYNSTTSQIEISGKFFNASPTAPIQNVSIYLDPNVNSEGTGTNLDYNAISYKSNVIGVDSFYLAVPISGLTYQGNTPYEIKVKLLHANGKVGQSIYSFNFDANSPNIPNNVIPINNSRAVRTQPWTAVATSKQPIAGGADIPDQQNNTTYKAGNVLDGDVTTNWYTPFSTSIETAYPHEIIIDTKSEQTFSGWSYFQPSNNIYIKNVEVYGGSASGVYELIGTYTLDNNNVLRYIQFDQQKTFQFFKFKALSGWSGGSLANYAVMSEIDLWKGPIIMPTSTTLVASTNWTVTAGTKTKDDQTTPYLDENASTGNQSASSLIDGKDDTYWYSKYDGATTTERAFPHEIIIDTKSKQRFTSWSYMQRIGLTYASKDVQLLTSDDNITYSPLANYQLENAEGLKVLSFNGPKEFRYLKIKVTSSHDSPTRNTLAEVNLYNDLNVTLPVELLTFDAKVVANNVRLGWSTASEHNSSYFNVMRFVAGGEKSIVGRVNAAGNSDGKLDYQFTDYNPLPGTSYYQLFQYDKDGTVGTTSAIKSVSILEKSNQLNVTNASNGIISFNIYTDTQKQTYIYITNLLGQKLVSKSFNLNKGNNTFSIPVNGNGLLLLTADFKDEVLTKKFIIQ